MNNNLIISYEDPRFGKIGHLWRRYSWDNIKRGFGRRKEYFIPPELIKRDYVTHRGTKILAKLESDSNWINSNSFANILWKTCELEVQEYCDLLVYHINDKLDRPRCCWCKSYLKFDYHLNQQYGFFCNESCSVSYAHRFSESLIAHDLDNILNPITRIKASRNSFLSRCSESAHFYIVSTDYGPKIGVASNLEDRISYSRLDNWNYKEILFDIILPSVDAANLEAFFKLENDGSELISPESVQDYIDRVNKLILDMIEDPFN
jgi:hypothetical protein